MIITLKHDLSFHKAGDYAQVDDECHNCPQHHPHFHINKWIKEHKRYPYCNFYSKYLFEITDEIREEDMKIEPRILKGTHGDRFDADQITMDNKYIFKCRKKPVIVHAMQINYPEGFKVTTKEGVFYKGKPGDYLIFGVKGEKYICDKEIFEETYETWFFHPEHSASTLNFDTNPEIENVKVEERKICKLTEHNYQILQTYSKGSKYITYTSLYCTKCGNVIEIKSSERG